MQWPSRVVFADTVLIFNLLQGGLKNWHTFFVRRPLQQQGRHIFNEPATPLTSVSSCRF